MTQVDLNDITGIQSVISGIQSVISGILNVIAGILSVIAGILGVIAGIPSVIAGLDPAIFPLPSTLNYLRNFLYVLNLALGGNKQCVFAVYNYYVIKTDCCNSTLSAADV